MRSPIFFLVSLLIGAVIFAAALLFRYDYVFFAGFVVLQFIVLATAWNVLGGYCGYVNFGSAAFFAVGAYSSVAIHKFDPMKAVLRICFGEHCIGEMSFAFLAPFFPMPIPAQVVIGGIVAGAIGLGMGYLTLRLRGAFFAIATLALAVVLQTLVINWDYVGGSRGAYIIRPSSLTFAGIEIGYVQYLFLIMLVLSAIAITVARLIERSRLGYGFATIRDDELAAEACGVPTLRLKLIATTISGALMGMAGAPMSYYIGYLEPGTAFGLSYGVNSIAMPMIGGTTSWVGPLIGAILLGTLQQVVTVTISSSANLLIVGLLLVTFVIMAPNGVVGLVKDFLRTAAPGRLNANAFCLLLIATYCFLVGLGGVILGLSAAMSSKGPMIVGMGICALAISPAYLASAYGLLKLGSWAPLLATTSFAASIPLSLVYIWMDPTILNTILELIGIAVAVIAIWYLQSHNVKQLYRPLIQQRAMP